MGETSDRVIDVWWQAPRRMWLPGSDKLCSVV